MENIIYEKDYSANYQEEKEMPDVIKLLKEKGFFDFYGTMMNGLPKRVVEKDKETYERVLQKCDLYAQRIHGKVYGIVDYKKWEAHIYLTVPFWEMADEEDRAFWRDIVENVSTVCVESAEDGGVVVKMLINYFEEFLDQDMPDEEVQAILAKAMQAVGKELKPGDNRWKGVLAAFRKDMKGRK